MRIMTHEERRIQEPHDDCLFSTTTLESRLAVQWSKWSEDNLVKLLNQPSRISIAKVISDVTALALARVVGP